MITRILCNFGESISLWFVRYSEFSAAAYYYLMYYTAKAT